MKTTTKIVMLILSCSMLVKAQTNTDQLASLRALAENGDANAQYSLGLALYKGQGVVADRVEATKWWNLAAKQGNRDAQNVLRNLLNQYTTYLRQKADQGDAKSIAELQSMSNSVQPIISKFADEQNKEGLKAKDLLDAKAQYYLGLCFSLGEKGHQKDPVEAVKWFMKAAEFGYAPAQYELGMCYKRGFGIDQDSKEYAKWIKKAAEQGDVDSMKEIQNVINSVQPVTPKIANDQSNYPIKSKDLDAADTDFLLGINYLLGKNGFQKEPEEAVRLFRKSAGFGYAPAQYMLGMCYKYGGGIDKDPAEYANWVRKAADQGETNALEEIKKMEEAPR